MSQLEIQNLDAEYDRATPILSNIDLRIEAGEIVSVIGPSGSGKSTLMRVLIGLLPPVRGTISLDGKIIDYANRKELRALRDRMAMVFQQFNLFQNMTVLRNVTIAPVKIKREPKAEVEARAVAMLERVGLGDKFEVYPDQLSGGQQQRVALARALTLRPEILLLDEITSALDPEMVNEVLDAIRELSRDGITMILVSHEMAFVREVSHKVVMMAQGRVVETGPPSQIFTDPQTKRCRDFISKIIRH